MPEQSTAGAEVDASSPFAGSGCALGGERGAGAEADFLPHQRRRDSIHEPTYYGTFRLIDAASRLIGFMLEHDPPKTGAFLRELKTELDTKKVWMMWDRDGLFRFPARHAGAGGGRGEASGR